MVKPNLSEKTVERYTFTVIETKSGSSSYYLSIKDVDALIDLYDSLPHERLLKPCWDFISNIDFRARAEWCMTTNWRKHNNYQGEGFNDFIRKETHSELVRQGYQWNETHKRFENLDDQQYQHTRQRVLGGLAVKAIDLFSDWNARPYPPSRQEKGQEGAWSTTVYDDKRNLRGSLADYITRYDSSRKEPLIR